MAFDHIVDVMEEIVKFTLLARDAFGHLMDRYSGRQVKAVKVAARLHFERAL